MALAQLKLISEVTAENQISIPAEIREKRGVVPGSVLEWEVEGNTDVVRRGKGYTSLEIHKMLFPDGPPEYQPIQDMKDGIADYLCEKYGRR